MRNIAFSITFALLTLTACGGKKNAEAPLPSKEAEVKSVYRVASELSKFPVVMHDTKTGKVRGFEAELLQAVADKQGFKVEYTVDNWGGLFHKLENEEVDMILGSVTITDERKAKMDFSDPVLPYKTGVMVPPKFANIKTFKELQGKKINLRKNTVYGKLIPIFKNENETNMIYVESVWEQMKGLLSGEADGMVAASITLEYYQQKYPDKKFHIIYDDSFPVSHYGWAVKKGDDALLNRLNMGLNKVKQDGTYDKIYKKYWGEKK